MDDDKNGKSDIVDEAGVPNAGARQRTPPTIDLVAAHVSDRASPKDGADAAAPPPPNEPSPSWRERLGAAMPSFTRKPFFVRSGSVRSPGRTSPVMAGALAGILAGSLVAAIALGTMWLASGSGGVSSRIVSRLPQSTSKADMEALGNRVAKIESRAANSTATPVATDPALTARIETVEKSIAALRDDLSAARTAIDDIKNAPREPPVDLSAIEQRLGKIERATVALTGEMAAPQKSAEDDLRVRRVAAANLLETSVRQGEPYSAALAAAKPLAENADALKALDPFAATGVPSSAALSRELLTLLPKLTPPPPAPSPPSGVLDRLQQSASKLVRIQRTDAAPGETAAIVARAAAAAQGNDIAAARRELTMLPASDRTPVQPWLDKAEAREAAVAASRQFTTDTITALSKPAQ